MERYYLKVKGMQGPVVAHDSLADAYTEARRLFEKFEQIRRVYVLQVIGTIDPPVVEKKPKKKRVTAPATNTEAASSQTT